MVVNDKDAPRINTVEVVAISTREFKTSNELMAATTKLSTASLNFSKVPVPVIDLNGIVYPERFFSSNPQGSEKINFSFKKP